MCNVVSNIFHVILFVNSFALLPIVVAFYSSFTDNYMIILICYAVTTKSTFD